MPSFHLHLHECGVVIRDVEGHDYADAAHALAAATTSARELMCASLTQGRICLSCAIVVEDADGTEIGRVPFGDAVRITATE